MAAAAAAAAPGAGAGAPAAGPLAAAGGDGAGGAAEATAAARRDYSAVLGRPLELELDLHPRLRAAAACDLLRLNGAALQDAWVLLDAAEPGGGASDGTSGGIAAHGWEAPAAPQQQPAKRGRRH
jgi:hypothetical protein